MKKSGERPEHAILERTMPPFPTSGTWGLLRSAGMKLSATGAALLGTFILAVSGVQAQSVSHWPQFRGPNSPGTSAKARPPSKFGPEDHQLWKVSVPRGPLVSGSGEEVLWQANFGERILVTPALSGNRVCVRTQEHLYAFGDAAEN